MNVEQKEALRHFDNVMNGIEDDPEPKKKKGWFK